MSWVRAVLVVAMALLPAAPAGAATLCVGPAEPCKASLAAALAEADANPEVDRIEIGALTDDSGPWQTSRPLAVVGAAGTVLVGDLELTAPVARLSSLTVRGDLRLAGHARRVVVEGGVTLLDDAAAGTPALLSSRVVGGPVLLGAGTGTLDSVEVRPEGGDGVRAECSELDARHLTVVPGAAGGAQTAVKEVCTEPGRTADVDLSDSVVWGAFTAYTSEDVDIDAFSRIAPPEPGFTSAADLTPAPDSVLLDAADPTPLGTAPEVALEDAAGLARAADGDGNGVLRRDLGAYERPASQSALPTANLLSDAGAELGGGAWSGQFVVENYGSFPFPSHETGTALGAGGRFFSGGYEHSARASQVVDLTGSAPEIDAGAATVTLSALVGGYRADPDEAAVVATFRDPHGAPIGTLPLPTVTPADRGHAVTLVPRDASGEVPPLTRSIEVALVGTRSGGGAYTDTYFDNVALVADIPGLPPPPPPGGGGNPGGGGPPPPAAKPFAGVTVLSSTVTLDRRGWAPLRVACASATVGRCAGVLTITTIARAGKPAQRLGSARFSLAPGRVSRVRVHIAGAARRTLRKRRHLRVRLYAAARDAQGQSRATTSPLRLRAPVRR